MCTGWCLKTAWVCTLCTGWCLKDHLGLHRVHPHVSPAERFFPCTVYIEFSAFSQRREVEYAVCSVGKLALAVYRASVDFWGVR
mmetsp:Transcript_74081/g.122307  ORF Transcript_74081/g.122307 Transcript_74081/m.122307 type:complete len:84 (-) Transcript_74081:42-293(-)